MAGLSGFEIFLLTAARPFWAVAPKMLDFGEEIPLWEDGEALAQVAHPWQCPRPGWFSGRCPCPWQRWNWMILRFLQTKTTPCSYNFPSSCCWPFIRLFPMEFWPSNTNPRGILCAGNLWMVHEHFRGAGGRVTTNLKLSPLVGKHLSNTGWFFFCHGTVGFGIWVRLPEGLLSLVGSGLLLPFFVPSSLNGINNADFFSLAVLFLGPGFWVS